MGRRSLKNEVTTHIVQVQRKAFYNDLSDYSNEKASNVDIKNVVTNVTSNSNNDIDVSNSNTDNSDEMTLLEKLHQIYANSELDLGQILCSADRNSEVYASALYEKARRSEISEEELRRELENILVYGLLYTDMDEEEWNACFGKLQGTIAFDENVCEYYYPLARYVHEKECNMEHHPDMEGMDNITCDYLSEKARDVQKQRSFIDYVMCMVYNSESEELIKPFEALCEACDDDYEAMIEELRVMYEMQQVPRCLTEEEISYFKIMGKTVSEDNIFSVYGKLAIFVHLLDCDFEHYVDECDVHKCKGLEKSFES